MKTMKKVYLTPQVDVVALETERPVLSASDRWLITWLVFDDEFSGLGNGGDLDEEF